MKRAENRIKEMLECGFDRAKVVNILLHATKLRKLKLYEIKFIEDHIREIEIKAKYEENNEKT